LLDASFIGRRWSAPAQMTCTSADGLHRHSAPAEEAVLRGRSPEIRRSARIPGYSVVKGQNETYIFANEYSYHVKYVSH